MSKKKASSPTDQQAQPAGMDEAVSTDALDVDLSMNPENDSEPMDAEDTQVVKPELDEELGPEDETAQEASATEEPMTGDVMDDEALVAELSEARLEIEAMREQCLRTQAEMDNLRKRTERDVENAHKFGVEKIATELLTVRDNLERGLEAATQDGAEVAQIIEGTELTLRSLTQVMEKFSIEEVNSIGEKFDPDRHQAISMQPMEGAESNTVLTVIQKGYTLNDRLIRPAMVIVAK